MTLCAKRSAAFSTVFLRSGPRVTYPIVLLSQLIVLFVCPACAHQRYRSLSAHALDAATIAIPLGDGEGMWPLGLLQYIDEEALRAKGLQIPLAKLWTQEEGGLTRAAIKLQNGCSGSFVSSEGLILTNHHCAHHLISKNSTKEHNILKQGFVAQTRAEELSGQGTTIQVIHSFRDVSKRFLENTPEDLSKRTDAQDRLRNEIIAECEQQSSKTCYVSRFVDGIPYEGNPDGNPRYTLFETTEVRDVRLVAAPPASIGHYGGETDNWHWPRHSSDFAVLRAYVGPDGSPADYSESNIPYRPEEYLLVSTEGLGPGDFVMVMGYPWETRRHLTAVELEQEVEWYLPQQLDLFSEWSQLLHAQAERDEEVAILMAEQIQLIDNALLIARGGIEAFARNDIVTERREIESALDSWVAESTVRSKILAGALEGIEEVVERRAATRERDLLLFNLTLGSQLFGFARIITRWAIERERPDLERTPGYQNRYEASVRSELEYAQRSFQLEADRAVFRMLLGRIMALPQNQRVTVLDRALRKNTSPRALDVYTRRLYRGSQLGEQARRLELFGQDLETIQQSEDTMIQLAFALAPILDEIEQLYQQYIEELAELRPRFVYALVQSNGRRMYPDATSTLRISFGNVRGYSPRDGILYTPFTTVGGLVEKNTGDAPFNAPAEFLAAAQSSPSSRWADSPLGDVPACFLSDLDTSTGSSGSPVLNGQGGLVGLLFDGVWEDLSGDFVYNPRVSRSISVDIRFVLWMLEEVMEADHLLQELGIGI